MLDTKLKQRTELKMRIEKTENKNFDFYYENKHPMTGEITEGVFKDKTLKEIKAFAERRELGEDAAALIKQTSSAIAKEKRAKKQASQAKKLEILKAGEWFKKGDSLLNNYHSVGNETKKLGKVWKSATSGEHRTYFNSSLSEQIMNESGLEYLGHDIFYDHVKKTWSSKKLGTRQAKKLNTYLV